MSLRRRPPVGIHPTEGQRPYGRAGRQAPRRFIPEFRLLGGIGNGRIPKRRCVFFKRNPLPHTTRLPRTLWRLADQRVTTGHLMLPNFTAGKFNVPLRAITEDIRIGRASGLPSGAFRRGSTLEIRDKSPDRAAIITSGEWAAAGFLSYLYIQMDGLLTSHPY